MAKKKSIHVTDAKETRTWIQDGDLELICKAWQEYEGDITVIESAIGALVVGRLCGYDALRVLHSSRTLRKYEAILDVVFKDVLKPRTKESPRVNGIRYADAFGEFWRALAAGITSKDGARMATKDGTPAGAQ